MISNLRDVFEAIRDDEGAHVATMRSCQTPDALRSPNDAAAPAAGGMEATCQGVADCLVQAPTGWRPPPT